MSWCRGEALVVSVGQTLSLRSSVEVGDDGLCRERSPMAGALIGSDYSERSSPMDFARDKPSAIGALRLDSERSFHESSLPRLVSHSLNKAVMRLE